MQHFSNYQIIKLQKKWKWRIMHEIITVWTPLPHISLPLTVMLAVNSYVPASLCAAHVYHPAWIACTEPTLRIIFLSPRGTMVTLKWLGIDWPLNNHFREIGESPSITAHGTVMSWPSFKGRSPNVKGKIFGGTETLAQARIKMLY